MVFCAFLFLTLLVPVLCALFGEWQSVQTSLTQVRVELCYFSHSLKHHFKLLRLEVGLKKTNTFTLTMLKAFNHAFSSLI